MYTATMRYTFREESFEEGCAAWKETVLAEAARAPGLVRMQFLTARPAALAVGTWQDKEMAGAFMRTGVFKRLMARLEGLTACEPKAELWELDAFLQRD